MGWGMMGMLWNEWHCIAKTQWDCGLGALPVAEAWLSDERCQCQHHADCANCPRRKSGVDFVGSEVLELERPVMVMVMVLLLLMRMRMMRRMRMMMTTMGASS